MATKGDITANVGISIKTEDAAVKGLQNQLAGLATQVEKAVRNGLDSTGRMSAAAAKELRGLSKSLNDTQKTIDTLQKYSKSNQRLGNFLGDDAAILRQSKAIKNIQDFRRGLEQATTTADMLKARINELSKAQVDSAGRNNRNLESQVQRQNKLTAALKEYQGIQSKFNGMNTRISLLTPDSQNKLKETLDRARSLQETFDRMASNRRIVNFGPVIEQQKQVSLELQRQISLMEAQEKLAVRSADKTRQRARDMLATTPRMEQGQIASAGRKGFLESNYQGMNTNEFEQRLSRATQLYAITKRQLSAEIDKGDRADTGRLDTLMGRYTRLQNIIGQTSAAFTKYGSTNTKSIQDMEKRVEALNKAYDSLGRAQRKTLVDDARKAVADGTAALKDFDKQLKEVGTTATGAGGVQSKLQQSLSGLLGDGGLALGSRIGIYALAAQGIYGVINAVRDGARFVIQFEDKLAQLQAISGSTTPQMEELSRTILDVSKNSRFSAVEIAEATIQLAQAGFSADDLKESLGSITAFAAASGTSVKESVDLVTGAIGAFQLQASEAGRITDIFTAALNRSRLTSQQIAQAIQYVGTTAYEQNISLEQLVATIGSVAQAGVKAGSTLGTGFRQFLVDLANPTEKLKDQLERLGVSLSDIDIKTRGLPAVLDTLAKAGFGAAQAYEGLEVRAAAFYLAAKNNVDVSNQLMLAESQRGVATEAAARAMDSLNAQWTRFTNILGEVASDSAPTNFLKGLVRLAADLAEKIKLSSEEYAKLMAENKTGANGPVAQFQTWAEETISLTNILGGLSQGLANILDSGVTLGKAVGLLSDDTKGWGESWLEYANSLVQASDSNEAMATATAKSREASSKQAQTLASVSGELTNVLTKQGALRNDSVQVAILTNQLTSRFEGLAGMLGNTANAYDNLVIALRRYQEQQLRGSGNALFNQSEQSGKEFTARSNTANQQIAALRNTQGYRNLSSGDRSKLEGEIGKAGGNDYVVNRLTDIVNTFKGAGADLKDATAKLRNTLAGRQSSLTEWRSSRSAAMQSFARSNPRYGNLARPTEDAESRIATLSAQAIGKSQSERETIFKPLVAELTGQLPKIQAAMRAAPDRDTRKVLEDLAGTTRERLGQIRSVVLQTKDEAKADAKADRAAGSAQKANERAAERAQSQLERNNLAVANTGLRAADRSLSAYTGDKRLEGKLSAIPDFFAEGEKLLENWVEARNKVKDATIAKGDMSPEQIAEMTENVNAEIAAKSKQFYQAQIAVITDSFAKFLKTQADSIQNEFETATRDSNRSVAIQQGSVTGAGNPLYRLSDTTRAIAQRRLDRLNQDNNQVTYEANKGRIESNYSAIDEADKRRGAIEAQLEIAKAAGNTEKVGQLTSALSDTGTTLKDLIRTNDALVIANDALKATIDAKGLGPQSVGGYVKQGAAGFLIKNNINTDNPLAGLAQETGNLFSQTLDVANNGLGQALDNIVMKTKNVGQAFKSMGNAVRDAIVQMATQAVASQIFGLLLSFIPGVGGMAKGTTPTMGGAYNSYVGGIGKWQGGKIGNETPQRLAGGGRVSGGLPTRDSTLVHAAKGEFMLRGAAASSIGEKALNDMNSRGAAALKGMGDKNLIMPQSQLNSNVYVVLPEEKPTLGPSDILAVVSRDVLRGGATKQLIKQVVAGG